MPSTMPALSRRFSLYAVLFVILYFIFEAVLVSLFSLGAGLDDAELVSNLSFWNWGYGGSQPPLYTWFAYGLTKLFGLHFALLQFLKFALLCSTFLAVYGGLRLLDVPSFIAACAMLSVFLLPQISWESQRALIHSVMGTAGSAWCFAAFAGFIKSRSPLWAVLFGFSIAAAVLGKYNGALFVLALLAAALSLPEIRPVLKNRWFFGLSLPVALLAMAPALVFMVFHPEGVVQRAAKFDAGLAGNLWFDRIAGVLTLAKAGFSFTALALVVALVIWLLNRQGRKKKAPALLAERFVASILLAGLALVAVFVVILGVTHIKDRWLQPVLFLMPVWLTLLLARIFSDLRACKAFGIAGLVAALLVPPFLVNRVWLGWGRDKLPQQSLDYPALEQALKAHGPVATVFSTYPLIAGNLRLLDPAIKTLFSETPFADTRLVRPLVVLWEGGESIPQSLRLVLEKAQIPLHYPVHFVDVGYRRAEKTTRRVYYIYIP